jgi:hypothetical protein
VISANDPKLTFAARSPTKKAPDDAGAYSTSSTSK